MALFGPAIRGIKAYDSNRKLKEKLEELEKLSKGPKKNLFSKEEWAKIKSNFVLTSLYQKGLVNGQLKDRQKYYNRIIDEMAKEIEANKKELLKENAKKIDIARLGLSIQKLAQEVDLFEDRQNKSLGPILDEIRTDVQNDVKDIKLTLNSVKNDLTSSQQKFERKIDDKYDILNKRLLRLRNDMNSQAKEIEVNTNKMSEISRTINKSQRFGVISLIILMSLLLIAIFFFIYS